MQIAKRLRGTVRPCACGKQPVHVSARGRREHWLECAPCLVRTPRADMLSIALASWESATVAPLALDRGADILNFRKRA